MYVCVCIPMRYLYPYIIYHISYIIYPYLRSTLYMLRNFSIFAVYHLLWDEQLNIHHYRSRRLRSLHTIWKDSPNTIDWNSGFELHVAAFGSCKKNWKCFCFKKNLKQRWGVVVSFNVRKHMSYKASLSRRKDSSEFSTNWWKLRTALGKQFTSHIISPGRVESPNFPSQFCHLSATRPLLVGQKCQVVIHL